MKFGSNEPLRTTISLATQFFETICVHPEDHDEGERLGKPLSHAVLHRRCVIQREGIEDNLPTGAKGFDIGAATTQRAECEMSD